MDADGLPLVGPGVDYTQVEPIQPKRSVAFINHFITHTAQFLNRFAGVCEEKLETMASRIQQLEITMSILEAKLSSVPGLENVTVETSSSSSSSQAPAGGSNTAASAPAAPPAPGAPAPPAPAAPAAPAAPVANGPAAPAAEEAAKPTMTVSQDPRYAKYFKMMQVGVPVPAVKTKMGLEGLNPDLLDTPDAPAPAADAKAANDDSDDDFSDNDDKDSDSVSSFSD